MRLATASGPEPAPSRNLSDLLVEYLKLLGVEYVFGVPGGHNSALFEALDHSEKRGGPRMVMARHESGAVNMADGYARETGRLGVCTATTGPGSTNLITGLASAYIDHTPMLVVTGQTLLPEFGAGSFQESSPDLMDTAGMLAHCTRYGSIVTHPKQFERKLITALNHALRLPRGPVHLSIPVDLSRAPAPALSYSNFMEFQQDCAEVCDLAAVDRLGKEILDCLHSGKRIVILVGHHCDGASQAILSFAERVRAAVITTQRGKRWVSSYHPLVRGVFGFAGHSSARQALTDDSIGLVLAAGTGLGQWSTSTWDHVLLNDKLVHIHPCNQYFSRSPMARLHVQADVASLFATLLTRLDAAEREGSLSLPAPALAKPEGNQGSAVPAQITVREPDDYHCLSVPIHPQRLVWELMQRFPKEARFLIDTSNWLAWTIQYLFLKEHQNYRNSAELAAMGWAIGAAVGTALATPGVPTICLTGDGCFLMSGQEITVAVEQQLPVVYVILNDGGYGMVKHRLRQISKVGLEFGFPRVDFAAMAQAMGAHGCSIHTVEELQSLDVAALCTRKGPTILDVFIDPEATPPMGMF